MGEESWEVLERARELADRGESFALATIVWRQAPSSGQTGARALITADGVVHGFIGGACAEPVVIREAQRVIESGEARLLFLGTTDSDADPTAAPASLPDGMLYVPMSCQSEGALQVFIEPVVPVIDLLVVGRSPMVHLLAELATSLGWQARVADVPGLGAGDITERTLVVVATQGHGDEEALELAARADPAFLGLVASEKRGLSLLEYLAERGVPREQLDRVHTPVGIDLGHTTHREIAVSVLAELVQHRAAGHFGAAGGDAAPRDAGTTEATDPVCGMTVTVDASGWSAHTHEHEGTTYHFCCVGCRDRFAADPAAYLTGQEA
ncbi:MAG TPA: XdhC family protein [Nocardioides sp.]|uniref:XdhC family protein n=1 Tax=Nocardioides sp. TaxID=35761 RepID=UPI002E3513F2|nr:XdhC family protein [Nocardioides sp.]HEX5090202.1 XdhC family protein [Nocardioides sp.]